MLLFDVFGRRLGVVRSAAGWRAMWVGTDGKRRDAHDVAIPEWMEEHELGRFLADLFHEAASPSHLDVVPLASREGDDSTA